MDLTRMDSAPGWPDRWVAENGAKLRALRRERGNSQKHLADAAGVNVSQVSRVEAGRDAQLTTLLKIYDGLGYRFEFDLQEICEEAGDLLAEESERRRIRREDGMLSGKRWR
jgi:transcriptional regulator with XRE-family HTH domain